MNLPKYTQSKKKGRDGVNIITKIVEKEFGWTKSQKLRAEILFNEYPDLKEAYYLAQHLGFIYHQCKSKETALTRLAHWLKM